MKGSRRLGQIAESLKHKAESCFKIVSLAFGFLLVALNFLLCCSSDSSNKFKQYYVKGEQLYAKHCSNCHQKDGTGLGLLYPPLNQSDYMQKNFENVVCLIRSGKSGELVVNGKSYNKEMPPTPSLTDLEIAEIATYIYNSWQNQRGIVDVREAHNILKNCGTGVSDVESK